MGQVIRQKRTRRHQVQRTIKAEGLEFWKLGYQAFYKPTFFKVNLGAIIQNTEQNEKSKP